MCSGGDGGGECVCVVNVVRCGDVWGDELVDVDVIGAVM